jgi:chorismate mutase-like protein
MRKSQLAFLFLGTALDIRIVTMNIEYWRTEIDEIDRELLRLLNRRARLAMKVGALKRAAGLPCCDPEREALVLTQLQQANTGPLAGHAVTELFRCIMREARLLEESEQRNRAAVSSVGATQRVTSESVAAHEVLL